MFEGSGGVIAVQTRLVLYKVLMSLDERRTCFWNRTSIRGFAVTAAGYYGII